MRPLHIATAVIILLALVITAFALMTLDAQRRAAELQMQVIRGTMARETAYANASATIEKVLATLTVPVDNARATERSITTDANSAATATFAANDLMTLTIDFQTLGAQATQVFRTATAKARGG